MRKTRKSKWGLIKKKVSQKVNKKLKDHRRYKSRRIHKKTKKL